MAAHPAAKTLSNAVRRGELLSAACPSRDVLKHVTSRWGVLLLMVLMGGTHRFSELHRKIGGVSEKMLAQTLRWLEDDGFVDRVARPTVPPHVEYSLTPLGREVGRHVETLADWIEASMPVITVAQQTQRAVAAPLPGRQVIRAGRVVASRAPAPRPPVSRRG